MHESALRCRSFRRRAEERNLVDDARSAHVGDAKRGGHGLGIRERREITERDEEIRILPTPAQRVLKEEQTLERDFLTNPVLKPEMTRTDIHASHRP